MACPEGTFVEPSCCCFYKCNRLFISIHCSTKGSTTKLVESNRSRQNFVILFLLYIRRCLSIKDPKMGWQFGTLVVLCFFLYSTSSCKFSPHRTWSFEIGSLSSNWSEEILSLSFLGFCSLRRIATIVLSHRLSAVEGGLSCGNRQCHLLFLGSPVFTCDVQLLMF